jgi:hypothetical protein
MIILASSSVGALFRFCFQNFDNFIYLKYSNAIKNLCNNTFIRAIYVCDILCVLTLVMTPRKDPGYD